MQGWGREWTFSWSSSSAAPSAEQRFYNSGEQSWLLRRKAAWWCLNFKATSLKVVSSLQGTLPSRWMLLQQQQQQQQLDCPMLPLCQVTLL